MVDMVVQVPALESQHHCVRHRGPSGYKHVSHSQSWVRVCASVLPQHLSVLGLGGNSDSVWLIGGMHSGEGQSEEQGWVRTIEWLSSRFSESS